MHTKKIYLIRHGQTEFNKKGIVQGSGVDAPLNDLGRQQADSFFNSYKEISFDKVYTSKLIRSIQSVQGFLDLKLPHEELAGLNEIHWGEKEGKPFSAEDHDYYLSVTRGWREGKVDVPIAGGESPIDVQNRQKVALNHILEQKDEETILICMHGRAMRIFLCLMLNYHLKYMDLFLHHNLCLYQLDYTGLMFSVKKFNDQEHLAGLNS